jgi:hypothetical protein
MYAQGAPYNAVWRGPAPPAGVPLNSAWNPNARAAPVWGNRYVDDGDDADAISDGAMSEGVISDDDDDGSYPDGTARGRAPTPHRRDRDNYASDGEGSDDDGYASDEYDRSGYAYGTQMQWPQGPRW